jgi:hypothetical protein
MASYYRAPPLRPPASGVQTTRPHESLAALDITDKSIYIFPAPSSLPNTPGGSSTFSVPSDFTDLSGSDTRSRNISTSISTHASTSRSPTGGRSRLSSGTVSYNSEIESWEWQSDLRDEGHEYWDYEEEIERVSQWDISPHRLTNRIPVRTHPLSAPSFPCTNDFIDQHYRAFLRSRAHSNSSSLTSNSRYSNRSIFTPHPRIYIPLLSFFASLLLLDLDDPALRLLTQSSADSVLFPGQPNLSPPEDDENELSSVSRTSTDDADTDLESVEAHGLCRLFASGAHSPVKLIKDGIAIVSDPSFSTPNLFSIPGLGSLQKFGQFIGNACYRGGQAWQELRLHNDASVSS